MATFDWGMDEPPHPDAPCPIERAPETPEELPEVRRLRRDGWELAPDAPFLAFLPSIWPPLARTWIPDRATRYLIEYRDGEPPERKPWPFSEYWEAAHDQAGLLAQAGVPLAPPGRLWLLRPAPGFDSVIAMLTPITRRAEDEDVPIGCFPEFVQVAVEEIGRAFTWTS